MRNEICPQDSCRLWELRAVEGSNAQCLDALQATAKDAIRFQDKLAHAEQRVADWEDAGREWQVEREAFRQRVAGLEAEIEEWKRHEGEACPVCHGPLRDRMALHLQAEVEESERVKELTEKLRDAERAQEGYRLRLSEERENHLLRLRQEVARAEHAEQRVAGADLYIRGVKGKASELGHQGVVNILDDILTMLKKPALTPPASAPEGEQK